MNERLIRLLMNYSRELSEVYFEVLNTGNDPFGENLTDQQREDACRISDVQDAIIKIAEDLGYKRKIPKPNATQVKWRAAGEEILLHNGQEN